MSYKLTQKSLSGDSKHWEISKREYEDLKTNNAQLENKLFEISHLLDQQKQTVFDSEKENNKNLMNTMRNEYEFKLNHYKNLTLKKLDKIKNNGQQKRREVLKDLIDIDYDNLVEEDYEDISYSSNDDESTKNNENIKGKNNSLLKEANISLNKENKTLKKNVDKYKVKWECYEKDIKRLKKVIKEQEDLITKFQVTETFNQNRFDNLDSKLNMSMPYVSNYSVKHQKADSFRMNRNDLNNLAALLRDTQSRRRGKTNTSRVYFN